MNPFLLLGFLVPVGSVNSNPYDTTSKQTMHSLPVFKRRWWHTYTLDIRPVCWSLRNHPEEWEIYDPFLIKHNPSNHVFYNSSTMTFPKLYGLCEADCSCYSSKKLTFIQKRQICSALKFWNNWSTNRTQPAIDKQFYSHFVHD